MAITIQCMLGLVCDPVAGLVEVPCVVRNASAAAIAFSARPRLPSPASTRLFPSTSAWPPSAKWARAMETRYKETALGGLAATKRGK